MVFVGVYLGLLFGLAGWFYGRWKAKKNKGLDELYYYVLNKSQGIAWYCTIIAIYVFMTLVLFGVELHVMFVLAMLLFVVLGSWTIAFMSLYAKLSEPVMSYTSKQIIAIILGSIMVIVFVVIALVIDNWKLIFFALPAIVINTAIYFNKK